MKKKIIFTTLICLSFIIAFLIGLTFINEVKGNFDTSDIPFTYESESYYESTNPSYNYTLNVRNQTKYTGHYNATYSFENDIIGNNPSEWNIDELGGSLKVIPSLSNHLKVVEFYDLHFGIVSMKNDFSYQIIGSIEFWYRINDIDKTFLVILYHNELECIKLIFGISGYDQWYNGTIHKIKESQPNIWQHWKIDFNCNINRFNITVNKILKYENAWFVNEANSLSKISFETEPISIDYFVYIDAIGYSWDYGHYNATYSFENEVDDTTGIDIDYIDIDLSSGNTEVKIINSLQNHKKILSFYDNDIEYGLEVNHAFDSIQTNLIHEFWWSTNNTEIDNKNLRIHYRENTEVKISIKFESNNCHSYHNTWNLIKTDLLANQWYHNKLVLNDTTNTFDWYINGILEGNNLLYYHNSTIGVDNNNYVSDVLGKTYQFIDAIGYSWDTNYIIGQNLFPIEEYYIGKNLIPYLEINPNIKEVDKYEFAFKSFQDLNDIDSSNPNSWIDVDHVDNLVKIAADTTNDRVISMSGQSGYSYEMGIYREFDILSGILNISWKIEIGSFGQTNNEVGIYIYSYDNTLLTYIFIENGYLKYDNGTDDIILDSGLSIGQNYEFNLYINIYDNITILNYYENDIYQDIFFLSLQVSNKHGLGKIEFLKDHYVGSISVFELDYIAIYVNGSSISTEFGIIRNYDMVYTTPMLYFTYSNLFSFTIDNTNMSLKISEYPYVDFNDVITEICSLDIYEGFNRFNHYDTIHDGNDYINATILWIQFYNQLELFEINIEGVRLTYELYEYGSWLRYTHNGIDTQENYFYENNNKLYFTHNANENDTLEYIQAEFLIQAILTTNRSIKFDSYFIGVSNAIFKVRFHGNTYNQFDFSKGTSKFNTILTQKKNLYSFIILITDNNDNNITGNSEGYTNDIKLIYYPDIELTILTLSLVEIMVPLIVLIIPTLAISGVYGKKAIIPMLILMTIICLIANLIQVEMFFIIMLCLGSALFLQYKKERGKM